MITSLVTSRDPIMRNHRRYARRVFLNVERLEDRLVLNAQGFVSGLHRDLLHPVAKVEGTRDRAGTTHPYLYDASKSAAGLLETRDCGHSMSATQRGPEVQHGHLRLFVFWRAQKGIRV
jgi:hypothetical protein